MAHYLAPGVASELDDIWYYVAKESGRPELADKLIDAIIDRFQVLAAHPHIGRRREDLRPGLRCFGVDDYLILYRVQDDDVLILHVLHGRRDIDSLVQQSH